MYFILLISLILSVEGNIRGKDPFNDKLIFGGTNDTIQNHPYIVAILDVDGFFCAGTILSDTHVLTAAHCIKDTKSALLIHAGSSFFGKNGSIHHVEYNVTYGPDITNDIAILRVTEPFVLDETRQPIPVFNQGETPEPGVLGTIVGWGATDNDGYSDQLLSVQVPIVDKDTCNNLYENTDVGPIDEGKICAGYLQNGGKDACTGDSGGPLVIDNRQAGIISMGFGCGLAHFPGIYTEVAFYNKWIMEQISL